MAGMINDLITIMKEQLTCYDYLLGLSIEKRDVIIKNDTKSLQKITNLEGSLVGQNNSLEKNRIEIIEDIACVLNLDSKALSISSLINLIKDQPEYSDLFDVSKKMRDKIELLKDSNEQNKVLVNNSLEYIDYTMNVFRTSFQKHVVSFDTKSGINQTSNSLFDARQ